MKKAFLAWMVFIVPFSLFAQYGAGGVGGNEDEKDETQPLQVLWLKADNLDLDDGDPVTEWPDASGYGFDATPGRPGNDAPVFRTSKLNGYPLVHFDLNNFFIIPDEEELDGGEGLSIFVVSQYDRSTRGMWDKDQNKTLVCKRRHWNAWSHVPEIPKDAAGLQHAYELRFEYDTTMTPEKDSVFVVAYINGNLPDGSGQDVFTDPLETSDPSIPYLIHYNYSGLEGSEGGRLTVNGISTKHPNRGELNPNPTLVGDLIDSDADLYIGAAELTPPGNYGYSDNFEDPFPEATEQALMEGGIAEVIMYRQGLNPTEISIVEHYLAAKYGLPMQRTMSFSNATHFHDLIGVGTENGTDLQTFSASGAFSIEAEASSLESAGEYLFAAHNKAEIEMSSEGFEGVSAQGWSREWYMQKSGSLDVRLNFDFIKAGLKLEDIRNYRLAFRSTPEENYTLLDLQPQKQLRTVYFELSDEEIQDGYYTIAYRSESTGLQSEYFSENLSFYPNPATSTLTVNLDAEITGSIDISFYDLTGRKCLQISGRKSDFFWEKSISISNLSAGVYLLKTRAGDYFDARKVLIQ